MNKINPSIFKEYDIRGKYPDEIDEDAVYKIGSAFCEYLNQKKHFGKIVVGRDARLSSPELSEVFTQGVLDQGRDVIDVGLCSTPLFYFALNSSGSAGGGMITASHNPKEYNGLKLIREGGRPVYKKDGLPEVETLANLEIARKFGVGKATKEDFSRGYLDFLKKHTDTKRPLKIVADASNGSAGPILEKFLDETSVSSEKLFFEPDGSFPNHSPNPFLPESRKLLEEKVKTSGADFGFIVDADGDRIFFIDEKGNYVPGDIMFAFLLDNLAREGDLILITTRESKILFEVAQRRGADVVRTRVGHANIKTAMRAKNARFGGELSGHFYFRDFYYSDSALLMLAHVLTLVSVSNKPFSELLKPYQKYFHSGELNFETRNPQEAIEKLKKEYSSGRQSFLDGLSVDFDSWWFNIRASKTEPLVRLVVEADSQKPMEEKIKELTERIK
ncbi:MAG: phosphomannomutase/phosphoglucomutase [Patescibacteria group bacterium]